MVGKLVGAFQPGSAVDCQGNVGEEKRAATTQSDAFDFFDTLHARGRGGNLVVHARRDAVQQIVNSPSAQADADPNHNQGYAQGGHGIGIFQPWPVERSGQENAHQAQQYHE